MNVKYQCTSNKEKERDRQLTVVHNGGGYVLSSNALSPGSFYIKVEFCFASVLTGILQVPLEWEVGVAWVLLWPHMVHQVLYPQRLIASLDPFEASLLHSQLHLQQKKRLKVRK